MINGKSKIKAPKNFYLLYEKKNILPGMIASSTKNHITPIVPMTPAPRAEK